MVRSSVVFVSGVVLVTLILFATSVPLATSLTLTETKKEAEVSGCRVASACPEFAEGVHEITFPVFVQPVLALTKVVLLLSVSLITTF